MKYKGKITDDLDLVHGKWSKANLIQKCSATPTSAEVAVGQPFMWVGDTTDYEGTTGFFAYGAYYKMTDGTPAIVKISSSGGGAEYTAGDDITISGDNKISVNRSTLLKDTPLTGETTAITPDSDDRSARVATTAYVQTAITYKQDTYDDRLETTDKNVYGAINEINQKVGSGYTAGTGILIDTSKKISVDTATIFTSPALTGTPTAPTADAGTNTTQIATTAYVMNLMKPTVILNGTNTNYVSAYNSRVNITNILLVKSGYNYSMDIKYTMNSSAKSAYAAGDTWNVMLVGSTLKNLIGGNPCFGIFHDNASTGDYAGSAILTASKNYFAISSIKALTVVDTSIYHMLLSFISAS